MSEPTNDAIVSILVSLSVLFLVLILLVQVCSMKARINERIEKLEQAQQEATVTP